MRQGLTLALRGYAIVFCTAANVRQVALGHYTGAFLIGIVISLLWWGNAHTSAHSAIPGARWWYAIGAGLGTVSGMAAAVWAERWLA